MRNTIAQWEACKVKKRTNTTTIYIRLLVLFFLALLPFFALSLMSNHIAEVRLREQSEERLAAQLDNMVKDYEDLHFRVYSWMKVNLVKDYEVLLGNDRIELSAYKLGLYVANVFSSLQELAQMSDDIVNVAVYLPRTGKMVSLLDYYSNTLPEDVLERIDQYKQTQRSFVYMQGALRIFSSAAPTRAQPQYVVEVTLSNDLLLAHLNEQNQESYAMLLDDGHMLSFAEDAALLERAREKIEIASAAAGQFVLDDYLLMYRRFLSEHYLVGYVPMETLLAPVQNFNLFSIGMLVLAALVSVAVCFYLSRTINRPFSRLIGVFHQVEQGNMRVSLDVQPGTPNEFAMVYNRFNEMIEQISDLMTQRVEQEKALEQAKYRELQAHIAPHFLYNSFNVLRHSILLGDEDTSAQMTKLLASYFKYLTYKGDQTSITLAEEYRHTLDYLEIQKIRFRDSIIVEIDPLPEAFKDVLVPPFVLQPLVENVFKHGIHDRPEGGKINVKLRQEGSELRLIVRDNGAGMMPEALNTLKNAIARGEILAEHSGIINIARRLAMHSGGRSRVEVDSVAGEYFEVRICLLIKERESEEAK